MGRSKRRRSPERSLDQEGTEDDERGSKFQAVGRLDDPDASAEEEDPAPVDLPGTRRRIIGKQSPTGWYAYLGVPVPDEEPRGDRTPLRRKTCRFPPHRSTAGGAGGTG